MTTTTTTTTTTLFDSKGQCYMHYVQCKLYTIWVHRQMLFCYELEKINFKIKYFLSLLNALNSNARVCLFVCLCSFALFQSLFNSHFLSTTLCSVLTIFYLEFIENWFHSLEPERTERNKIKWNEDQLKGTNFYCSLWLYVAFSWRAGENDQIING